MKIYTSKCIGHAIGFLTFLLLFSTPVFAFEYLLEKAFLQDKTLVKEELMLKDLQGEERNSTEISLFIKKNSIALNSVKFYLDVLKNEELATLYQNENENFLKLYHEKIEKNISSFDAKTLQTIKEILSQESANIALQRYNLESSISSFERFTKVIYRPTNLLENIEKIAIPKSSQIAKQRFLAQPTNLQKALLTSYTTTDISELLEEYFKENQAFEEELQKQMESLKKRQKQKESQDMLTFIKEKQALTSIQKNIIEAKYNILFQKCKISHIIGDIIEQVKNTQPKTLHVKEEKVEKTPPSKTQTSLVKLKRIHFASNSSEVSSYSINIVEAHAKILKNLKNFKLELYGHSDIKKGTKPNKDLSLARAQNTKNALVKFGVDPKSITAFGMGDRQPIASNETEKGRLLNRRVEFKFIEEK